jgi:hypothetical protein
MIAAMDEPTTQRPAGGDRSRLIFAGALAGLLAVAAIVLVSQSGGQKHDFVAAPDRCLDAWNDDPKDAPSQLGVHQYNAHGYNFVEVLTLSSDGSAPTAESEPTAICAVLFASTNLDPELAAAALIKLPAGWQPLSTLQQTARLADYQAQAQEDYNAELQQDGTIEPL